MFANMWRQMPTPFKIWFVFCAVAGVGMASLTAAAMVKFIIS